MPYYRRIGWYSGPCPPFSQRWRRGLVLASGSDRYGILLVPLSTEEVKLKKLDTSIFMDSHLFFSDHWNKTMTTYLTPFNLQKFVKFQNPTLATKITLGDRLVPWCILVKKKVHTLLPSLKYGWRVSRQNNKFKEVWIGCLTGNEW